MVNVSGDQPTKVIGILPRATAAAFMEEELDAIHIPEDSTRVSLLSLFLRRTVLDLRRLALPVLPDQLGHLLAIKLRPGKAQLFLKCLLEIENIPVFTKNQRHYEPEISRANLPVGAAISHESALLPARGVRRVPVIFPRPFVVLGCLVVDISGRQQVSTADRAKNLPDEDAIHGHACARRQILRGELVLGRNTSNERVLLARVLNCFASLQIS